MNRIETNNNELLDLPTYNPSSLLVSFLLLCLYLGGTAKGWMKDAADSGSTYSP